MRYIGFCIVVLALTVPHAQCQGVNTALDHAAEPSLVSQMVRILHLDCPVLKAVNPFLPDCGGVALLSNSSLGSWGFTFPQENLNTIIRINENKLTDVRQRFGDDGVVFVLAHELGHHFDLQFRRLATPFDPTLYPPIPPDTPLAWRLAWENELRADVWAGCGLKRNGTPIEVAEKIRIAYGTGPMIGPDTPAAPLAIAALRLGFSTCH